MLILLPVFVNGDRASIGMTTQGHEEWRSWGRALPALTVVTGVLAIPGLVAWWSIDGEVAKMLADPWHDPLAGFVLYPISEEIIYRMAICSAAAGWFGARPAIAVSGIVFGLMHVAYGVANPVNLVSGFVLAWSFLKSNTILVPITLHSFGNILGAVIIDCLGACFRHA
ncbi:MAG: CPBP family intramembrane metalloprotease [Planctomycetes bacterium]|nr:CPBP family intramembrane metalloprotease [Planctomycetota bacterium]